MRKTIIWILCVLLLAGLVLPGCAETAEDEINEKDMAAYAECINRLSVEYGIPVILWDCSVHVNRAGLSVNYPMYIDAITGCYPDKTDPGNSGDDTVFEEESARQAADNFGPGFNLGNTLDSTSFNIEEARKGGKGWIVQWGAKDSAGRVKPTAWETAWGQPMTTQKLADYIISLGFTTVRIPVTWAEHLDGEDNVDAAWMARVKTVVDYFHYRGVYCIINLHHDGGADGWIEATRESYETYSGRFASVWRQIAETFGDYDERLIFESMNEVLDGNNNWNTPSADASGWINAWNRLFVDTVRETGGNNALRNLMVMTYSGGGADGNFASFVLPEDPADHHLMITVHNYDPQGFTWTNATWTKMTARWDENTLGGVLRRDFAVYAKYAEKFDVPIVVGEYNADPKKYADYD